MTPESAPPGSTATPGGKAFPRYCDRCRKRTVWPATISYRSKVRYEGQVYDVDTPQLVVPRCQECGALYFDNSAEEQVSRALREQLHLLQPEQVRANRQILGLTVPELAGRVGVSAADLSDWEEGLQLPPRAVDNLLRAYFALPDLRAALRGLDQSPAFGAVVGAPP
jgi:DNA-binding transcriptional regulator YiaG